MNLFNKLLHTLEARIRESLPWLLDCQFRQFRLGVTQLYGCESSLDRGFLAGDKREILREQFRREAIDHGYIEDVPDFELCTSVMKLFDRGLDGVLY